MLTVFSPVVPSPTFSAESTAPPDHSALLDQQFEHPHPRSGQILDQLDLPRLLRVGEHRRHGLARPDRHRPSCSRRCWPGPARDRRRADPAGGNRLRDGVRAGLDQTRVLGGGRVRECERQDVRLAGGLTRDVEVERRLESGATLSTISFEQRLNSPPAKSLSTPVSGWELPVFARKRLMQGGSLSEPRVQRRQVDAALHEGPLERRAHRCSWLSSYPGNRGMVLAVRSPAQTMSAMKAPATTLHADSAVLTKSCRSSGPPASDVSHS